MAELNITKNDNGIMTLLADAKQVTSGVLVTNGTHLLNHPSVLMKVNLKEQE